MAKSIKAIFDGKVFRPQGVVKLPAHSVVEIIVRSHHKPKVKAAPMPALKLIVPPRLKERKGFSESLERYLSHTA